MGALKQLGRYELVRVLGIGAMGVVYEASDSKLHRRVAIKTVINNALSDPEATGDHSARFVREAQAIAKLNHPNIVTVYDFGEQGEIAYFVMELIEGHELKHYLDGGARLPLAQALAYMVDLLNALDYAHSLGIVHRDIKPANIMIDKSGRLKLTDFGVVMTDDQDGTQAESIVGTPAYVSPEQVLGAGVSPSSDIFAAGVILYELLTWRKPFAVDGVSTLEQKIVNDDPVPPSSLNADVPPFLDQIVAKALAKTPADRYRRAGEFSEELERFLASGTLPANASANRGKSPSLSAAAEATATDSNANLNKRTRRSPASKGKLTSVVTVLCADVAKPGAPPESGRKTGRRTPIQRQGGIILPAIRDNHGVFVKATEEGAQCYFESALSAVRAAVLMQRGMDELNMSGKFKTPTLMRIGMHTGRCEVTEREISGEVVDIASRLECSAEPGAILMSEDTYNALPETSGIYCRFAKQVTLKGKRNAFNAYKAFWNPREVELEMPGQAAPVHPETVPVRTFGMKLIWGIAILIGFVLLLTLSSSFLGLSVGEATRSVGERLNPGGEAGSPR